MRDHITMINRRRCLAENLNACTAEEIRQEVAKALHRKFPGRGHAVHVAAEILEATQEYGQPPRVMDMLLENPEGKWSPAWPIIALIVGAAAALAVGYWASSIPAEALTYQGVYRKG